MFLYLFAVFVFFTYFYATKKFDYFRKCGIPFDKPVPYVGTPSLVLFKHCLGTYLQELYEKFEAPLVGFFLFDEPQLVVRDPNLIRSILIEDFNKFDNRIMISNVKDDPASLGLFALKNPLWRPIRQKINIAFTSGKMKLMLPLMTEIGSDMLNYLMTNSHVPLEARQFSLRYTTDVIASCIYGVKGHSFEDDVNDFRVISKNIMKFTWVRGVQATCFFISPFLVKLFKMKILEPRSCKLLQSIFWQVVEQRQETSVRRNDFIDALMEIRKNDTDVNQYKLEGDVLVGQAVHFFVAGFETSASTACFGMFELAKQPDVQSKLRKEIAETLAKHSGSITYEGVQSMKYLDMVIHETLRKYPALPFLDRRARVDFHLPGSNLTIQKGMAVFVPLMGLHYDPNYFPEPERFDPERFSPENKSSIPSHVYLPFGDGPRSCIGARFGLLSVKLLFTNVFSQYEVLPCPETPSQIKFDPRGFMLTPAYPVKLQFKRISELNNCKISNSKCIPSL